MLLVLATVVLAGCSEKERPVLEFFFTGVPLKEQPAGTQSPEKTAAAGRPAVAVASAHSYFVHRQCTKCHGSSMAIISSGPERQARRATEQALGTGGPGYPVVARQLCLNCHKDPFGTSGQPDLHKHPPVSCTVCHRPHQSEHRYLLRQSPQLVCGMCHPNDQVDATDFHRKPLRR